MIKKFFSVAGALLVFFMILEGLCSTFFVAYRVLSPAAPARGLSGSHVRYDSDLGWASVPNFYQKNYYAPGIGLRTNSRGFRADEDFTQRVPSGRLRVICSGGSQTFGDGVGNDQTMCQVLEAMDSRLQPVNMAEVAYGVDQMYLRYKRSGAALDHDVHLFTFVTENFRRLRFSRMGGYGKPVLKLRNGELTADKAAVGGRSLLQHWITLKPHPLRQFRSVAILADLVDWIKAKQPKAVEGPSEEERGLVGKMIESLEEMEKSKNSILVLVFLPTRTDDYEPGGPSEPWREFLRSESSKRGVVFFDLVEDLWKLPVTTKDGLFIWPGETQYFAETAGHYSVHGHEYLGRQIYDKLLTTSAVAEKLARIPHAVNGGESARSKHPWSRIS